MRDDMNHNKDGQSDPFDQESSELEENSNQAADSFGEDNKQQSGLSDDSLDDNGNPSDQEKSEASEGLEPGNDEPGLVSARKKQTGSDEPANSQSDPIAVDPFARRRTRGNRAKHKRTPLTIFFDIVIASIALVGLYFVLSPMISNWQQDRMTSQLDDAYLDGDGIIEIDPDAWAVEGEELEYAQLENDTGDRTETTQPAETEPIPDETQPEPEETQPTQPNENSDNQDTVRVKAIGRIEIDSIDLEMPVASRSTVYDLRVAIGHYSPSAAFGEPGLTVLLGHRMYTRGRHFNRLDEVKEGHEVILSNKTHRYIYVVDEIRIVEPEEMLKQLRQLQLDEPRLMLVTCDPVRIASHRLLVYGHLASVEPLS